MAGYCNKCGDTGMVVNGRICTCAAGKKIKVAKAMDAALEKAKTAPAENVPEKPKTPTVDEINAKYGPQFKIGDWVISGGVVGIVWAIDARQLKFYGHHSESTGAPAEYVGWTSISSVKPAPFEFFEGLDADKISEALDERTHKINIDRALDAGNKELFLKLTQEKAL